TSTYVRGVQPSLGNLGVYVLVMGQVFEGFKLEMSPLMSRDQKTVDAVVSCQVERLEQFVPVSIEVPGYNRQVQSVQIQTPQMSSWALKERFRWPSDKVLLLSRGVVASPGPTQQGLMGVRELFTSTTGRAEVLLFLESRGKASENIILPGREGSIQRETNPRYRLIK
ncbi:MAG: hypothetical protein MPJ24_02095, partial [Pirellulaceae bacterium]|nr:hypothetical protein [Pirellulaceae bacterium]